MDIKCKRCGYRPVDVDDDWPMMRNEDEQHDDVQEALRPVSKHHRPQWITTVAGI